MSREADHIKENAVLLARNKKSASFTRQAQEEHALAVEAKEAAESRLKAAEDRLREFVHQSLAEFQERGRLLERLQSENAEFASANAVLSSKCAVLEERSGELEGRMKQLEDEVEARVRQAVADYKSSPEFTDDRDEDASWAYDEGIRAAKDRVAAEYPQLDFSFLDKPWNPTDYPPPAPPAPPSS